MTRQGRPHYGALPEPTARHIIFFRYVNLYLY